MQSLKRIPMTAELRALEADWIKECGESWGQVLMELAGKAVADAAFKMWKQMPGAVGVFCGRGNNGGDGMVVARYLHLWHVPVSIFIVNNPEKILAPEALTMSTKEAGRNKEIAQQLGIPMQLVGDDPYLTIDEASLIIDGLLGTGIDRVVEGAYRYTIDAINRSGRPVVAIDLPSGLNSDTGQIMGTAIRADRTVTFGYLKPGLLCHPGASLAGQVSLVDIGLPEVVEGAAIYLTTSSWVRSVLPLRPDNANKGTFGSVLNIAGSLGMTGATMLASESALRSGGGLVVLAAPRSVVVHLPPTEVIYRALPETAHATIAPDAIPLLEADMEKAQAIILGPGLSQHPETVRFVQEILPIIADSNKPCIIDADGLNAIAHDTSKFPARAHSFVLTPHPKELARLLGKTVAEIQSDRIGSARSASEKFGCQVLLKGSRTVIAGLDGRTFINPTGNSGMATAGAGDVLSGIIGGLLAQGIDPLDAAVAGAYLHGTAGDIASSELGEMGTIAGDISRAIPLAIHQVLDGQASYLESQLFPDDSSHN